METPEEKKIKAKAYSLAEGRSWNIAFFKAYLGHQLFLAGHRSEGRLVATPDLAIPKALAGADLRDADLRDANLYGADLSRAVLSSTDLSGSDLTGANLSKAIVIGANLSKTILRKAWLCAAMLVDVDLTDANLEKADLYGAYLHRVRVSEHTSLKDANLDHTGLTGVQGLTEGQLVAASIRRTTQFPEGHTFEDLQWKKWPVPPSTPASGPSPADLIKPR